MQLIVQSKKVGKKGYAALMRHKISGSLIIFLLVVLLIVGFIKLIKGGDAAAPAAENQKTAELINIGAYSQGATSISVVGTVRSEARADIHTQKSGQVTRVSKKIGDRVAAGEVIAEIENASERASLLSAQGGYDAAKAQQSIYATNAKSADASFASAEASARNALVSAYASADNAVRSTADSMISNPNSATPSFAVQSSNSQLPINVVSKRIAVSAMLEREGDASRTLSGEALRGEMKQTQDELRYILSMFDDIIAALNTGIATYDTTSADITAFLADAKAARTSLLSSLSALDGARESLDAKQAAAEVAAKNLESDDAPVSTADAALKQAEGALASARANYEKSIIRSPISGVVNALHINRGDFVQMGVPAAEVANNNALEIVAQVTEADAREIIIGTEVALEDGGAGVVTRVAPAISATTRKIEVRIGVTDKAQLVNGDTVTLTFKRGAKDTPLARLLIPITALKVESHGMSVLTIGSDGTLVARAVTIGTLLGDKVQILEGAAADDSIVADARGLRAGEKVEIK